MDGLRAPILATRISPRAGSAPLARWQGGSREHGDRVWFSETGHFERRPIPVRTTINPRHQLPHDQSRCITCTLYCHVGQAWYLPQTTDFMCHDEDVAKIELASLRGQSWTTHFCLRSGGCGPAGCSGEGCHKFHVFNRHQKQISCVHSNFHHVMGAFSGQSNPKFKLNPIKSKLNTAFSGVWCTLCRVRRGLWSPGM